MATNQSNRHQKTTTEQTNEQTRRHQRKRRLQPWDGRSVLVAVPLSRWTHPVKSAVRFVITIRICAKWTSFRHPPRIRPTGPFRCGQKVMRNKPHCGNHKNRPGQPWKSHVSSVVLRKWGSIPSNYGLSMKVKQYSMSVHSVNTRGLSTTSCIH